MALPKVIDCTLKSASQMVRERERERQRAPQNAPSRSPTLCVAGRHPLFKPPPGAPVFYDIDQGPKRGLATRLLGKTKGVCVCACVPPNMLALTAHTHSTPPQTRATAAAHAPGPTRHASSPSHQLVAQRLVLAHTMRLDTHRT